MSLTEIDAYNLYKKFGSYKAAADSIGVEWRSIKRRVQAYYRNPEYADMVAAADTSGIDPDTVSHYWIKKEDERGNQFSLFVKNENSISFDEMRELLIEDLKEYAPRTWEVPNLSDIEATNLLIIDPADIHVGKLAVVQETGYTYNTEIAIERVCKGVETLVARSQGFGISDIVLVIGNDCLHTDNTKSTTTSGTFQDSTGMWWENFLAAKSMYIRVIEMLAQVARVNLVYCPSNHDYAMGFVLADTIYSWFKDHPNVGFGDEQRSIAHRKYVRFGENLIGFTHGDGAKERDLPNLMQHEAREAWGISRHSYWYTHHYHHKIRNTFGSSNNKLEKDMIGITRITPKSSFESTDTEIEYVRSPSPPDSWHSRNGYVNRQAIEAFIHHPTDGQIVRFTTYF